MSVDHQGGKAYGQRKDQQAEDLRAVNKVGRGAEREGGGGVEAATASLVFGVVGVFAGEAP